MIEDFTIAGWRNFENGKSYWITSNPILRKEFIKKDKEPCNKCVVKMCCSIECDELIFIWLNEPIEVEPIESVGRLINENKRPL